MGSSIRWEINHKIKKAQFVDHDIVLSVKSVDCLFFQAHKFH